MKHMKPDSNKLSKKLAIAFCAILSLFIFNSHSFADTIEVPAEQLQTAINTASPEDVIMASSGTYLGDLTLKEGVAVLGKDRETTIIQGTITGASNTRFENFKVNGSSSSNTILYNASNCQNATIKNNAFVMETKGDYQGILLSNVTNAEIINNSLYLTSSEGSLIGINFSGDNVVCTNNSIYADGSLGAEGLHYTGTTHTVKNNIIKTATDEQYSETAIAVAGDNPLDVDYNILIGKIGENVNIGIGNLKGVDPCFVPGDTSLQVQETSPAIKAADPTYLYSSGVKNIGAYGASVVDNVQDLYR